MPAPYSDNLYSALDDEDDDQYIQSHPEHVAEPVANASNTTNATAGQGPDDDDALSPSDGYFHASDATSSPAFPHRQSSNVPDIPNVLVEDPTLHDDDRDTKTREAEHERRLSTMAALHRQPASPDQSSSPVQQPQSPSASSSRPRHMHRRSIEEDDDLEDIYESPQNAPSSPQHQHRHSQRQSVSRPNVASPLFQQQPIDAPPAYTPAAPSQHQQQPQAEQDQSPSSPASTHTGDAGYQTFGSAPLSAGATMGSAYENQPLLQQNREPESMGGEPEYQRPKTAWERAKRAFTITNGRRKLSKVLKWLLVFVIIVMVISSFSLFGEHQAQNKPKSPSNPPKTPGDAPETRPKPEPQPKPPAEPGEPKAPARPPVEGDDPKDGPQGDLVWKPRTYCHKTTKTFRAETIFDATFDPNRSFTIVQTVGETDTRNTLERRPFIEGEVILRSAPDSEPNGKVMVEILANQDDLGLDTAIDYETGDQDLRITTPRSVEWKYSGNPCVQMRVTVYTPPKSMLEDLTVNATHLNIDILKGLDLAVENEAMLHTVSGDVHAAEQVVGGEKGENDEEEPYLISKRKTIVRTISGDVKGWFALNDLLKITSVSGDIKVQISPQAVDPDVPLPAELILENGSGDIWAEEPIDDSLSASSSSGSSSSSSNNRNRKFPARDYTVALGTISGDIDAKLAITSYTAVRSESGDLTMTLWPVLDPSTDGKGSKPQLDTNTKSGDTKIQVLEPLWVGILQPTDQRLETPGPGSDEGEDDGKDPWVIIHPHDVVAPLANSKRHTDVQEEKHVIGNMISRHNGLSGAIRIRYPDSWEGGVFAETVSGSQRVRGEGLHMYETNTPLMKTVTGRKGKGASDLKLITVSGDEDVLIGDEPGS